MEITSEAPAKRPKRLTSVVWNHFERVRKGEICYAVCVHCKKKLSGSSNSGTTHLRNHLIRCLKRSNYDVSQILAAKRKRKDTALAVASVTYEEGQRKEEIITPISYKFDQEPKKEESNIPFNLGSVKFDQERSRLDFARMIMLHGYPLAMVEHVGFKIFVKNLQPLFEVMNNSAIELDCMTIYAKEKQKIYEEIHNLHGRISLVADIWVSADSARYLCLTAYYIDEDWKLRKKILNFVTLNTADTDDLLSEVVIKCLTDWAIDRKLFSMTFDECSGYDDMVFRIKDWLSQNKPLLKNGELFDVRCASNVLKSIVLDVMEALRGLTHKIRESIRHVKSSQITLGKFNEIARQVGINTERHLVLDYPMQWHSTYTMLETALEYRGAFSLLQENDADYKISLSETEWEWLSSVTGYVKLLVEVTKIFTGSKYLTANVYFPEICDIHIQLTEWCKSADEFLGDIATKMKAKFDQYWNKCSQSLAIAAILDPRFKMKLVEYYYPQIYGSDAPNHIKAVSDAVRQLFNEYAIGSTSLDQDPPGPGSLPSSSTGTRDRLRGFDKFLHETSQNQSVPSDLDKYLEEPVFPRNYDFNILNWWKVHTPRYPILSMIARDVLGVPASTLGPELAFSNKVRMLDQHKSSLSSDIREALVCGQDWLRLEAEEPNSSSINYALPLLIESS
ncbi:zinc finger BED domain-containing protein RICESLEEPER 1-like [Ipomoea triloba]|uniref:zinc finger BED domain-containing protein RICESLEEPER 1-like n=1 Tax=Ipomoea triloba TaxID=35885 RepID=UPI00125E555A|nr:zinc finger BED domain-containing protein RICESLEEPER 1-like [Ipomoea triloba]XP_031093018.1 zinc finger BED domain-containing protein RICESLEEPER 1-like [Ipomoea triloba]XP_031093019.1 zinc finger BED domain-containing protein RICESLEEPER 1-like [Ipomoea triloba]